MFIFTFLNIPRQRCLQLISGTGQSERKNLLYSGGFRILVWRWMEVFLRWHYVAHSLVCVCVRYNVLTSSHWRKIVYSSGLGFVIPEAAEV